jgi:plasmid replication initiation protein
MSKEVEVRQHNVLTAARYEYSELQLDVFFYLLSKLRKGQTDAIYQVSVPAMSELTGKKYNYKKLRESTQEMGSRCFEVETEHNSRVVFRQLWMFKRVDYIPGSGIIEVEFNEFAVPYLFDLKNNFTSFQLYSALRLTSKHAKRIYAICSQWKDMLSTKKFEVTELKKILGLIDSKGNEEYPLFGMFRKNVLDVAVKQINEHTDLHVGYKLEKQGRAYKKLCFTIKPQSLTVVLPELSSTTQLPSGVSEPQMQSAIRLLDELRIVDIQLRSRILSSASHIRDANKFAYDVKTGKSKPKTSAAGLLLTVLGIKGGKSSDEA